MVYRRILLLFVSLAILTTAERSQTSAINLVKLQRAFAHNAHIIYNAMQVQSHLSFVGRRPR